MRVRLETGSLLVGEWTCPETVAGLGLAERTRHHEIWLQRAGSCGMQVGARRVVGDAATAVFVNAGEVVRPSYPRAERQRSTALLVEPRLLGTLVAEAGEAGEAEPRFPAASAPVSPVTSLLHHALVSGAAQGEDARDETEKTALALLRSLVADARRARGREAARPRVPRTAAEMAESVQHLLARRYSEKLTLEEIAQQVGTSPFHLARTFSGHMGMSIHRYRVHLRLRMSLELMQRRPRDLSWVALEAGFASHSHFSSAFRGEYGVSPSSVVRSMTALASAA